jgi:RNA polymerase sigma-70 factor, ECF subfamily
MKLAAHEFEQLALEQIDLVYRVARRLARDPVQAEDLAQETYLRALRARDGFDLQQYGIRPWLLRILHNLYITQGQRNSRQPMRLDDEQWESAEPATADELPLNPNSFEGMDERLVQAIDDLPEEYRSVLLLWAVEDLSYKEIADALDIPIGTVMSRLHRTRQRLAEQLRGYAVQQRIIRE